MANFEGIEGDFVHLVSCDCGTYDFDVYYSETNGKCRYIFKCRNCNKIYDKEESEEEDDN